MTGVRICYDGGHEFKARRIFLFFRCYIRFCFFSLILYKIDQRVRVVLTQCRDLPGCSVCLQPPPPFGPHAKSRLPQVASLTCFKIGPAGLAYCNTDRHFRISWHLCFKTSTQRTFNACGFCLLSSTASPCQLNTLDFPRPLREEHSIFRTGATPATMTTSLEASNMTNNSDMSRSHRSHLPHI